MRILVTGSSGYIGGAVIERLQIEGHIVQGIDCVESRYGYTDYVVDLRDARMLDGLLSRIDYGAVVHLGAMATAFESEEKADEFMDVNVRGTVNLVQSLKKPTPIVFASTGNVYKSHKGPVTEESPLETVCAYTKSKLIAETKLIETNWPVTIFRFMNVAGGYRCGATGKPIGDDPTEKKTLIPMVVDAAYRGVPFCVYGVDFDTPDGTAVKDYVSVIDIADAIARAVKMKPKPAVIMNLGTSKTYSVLDVVKLTEKMFNVEIPIVKCPRRHGDIDEIWCDPRKAKEFLGWEAVQRMEQMIGSQWAWRATTCE